MTTVVVVVLDRFCLHFCCCQKLSSVTFVVAAVKGVRKGEELRWGLPHTIFKTECARKGLCLIAKLCAQVLMTTCLNNYTSNDYYNTFGGAAGNGLRF